MTGRIRRPVQRRVEPGNQNNDGVARGPRTTSRTGCTRTSEFKISLFRSRCSPTRLVALRGYGAELVVHHLGVITRTPAGGEVHGQSPPRRGPQRIVGENRQWAKHYDDEVATPRHHDMAGPL